MSRVQPSKLLIRLGEFEIPGRQVVKEALNSQTAGAATAEDNSNLYKVAKIIIHQQYEPRSHLHDIAVVWLDRAIRFSPVIQRICLPPPSLPTLEDQTAFVAGRENLT